MDNLDDLERPPVLGIASILEAQPQHASTNEPASADETLYSPVISQHAPNLEREVPTLSNTFIFFALAIGVTLIVGLLILAIAAFFAPHDSADITSLALDTRLAVPSQAIEYLILLALTVLLFRSIWQRPFWQTVHWNSIAVAKRWFPLLVAGIALGLINGAASNVLPMPKEAPILNDLMRSTAGAWLMFLFGTTLAPLLEEIAFRGFLLPSLINFFNWRTRRAPMPVMPLSTTPPSPVSALIVPASVLLASAPFAILHGEQVSWAWAPIALIGFISVVLCVVRLWTRSLAASTFVHGVYNFTLFVGMAIASDGFRHLDKLNN